MTRADFHLNILPGVLIYDAKRKIFGKVTRVFPEVNPSYAEYMDPHDKQLWGSFYKTTVLITKEKLEELKAKQAAKNDLSSNSSDGANE